MNLGFKALGYETISMDPDHASQLLGFFPHLRASSCEMRQWTIRGASGRSAKEWVETNFRFDRWRITREPLAEPAVSAPAMFPSTEAFVLDPIPAIAEDCPWPLSEYDLPEC
jgi:hypothetical protein